MKTKKIKGHNDFELNCYIWDTVENPIGVIQIIHGLQEHAKRYDEMANLLNKEGFIVLASDLRGHGITAMINSLPFGYSEGDIFMEIVYDQIKITEYLYKQYKLPITIIGHSFGSFIAQRYIIENGFKIKNIIMTGTTYTNSFEYRLAYQASKIGRIFKGKKAKANIIEKHSIKKYEKNFPNGNWLTRDESAFATYKLDPLCGMTLPYNFYYSFFKNTRKNYKNLKNIPYYLPILLLAGTSDIVSKGKGIFKLFVTYGKSGKKVFLKTYLHARHELYTETNKKDIILDIANFAKNSTLDFISITPNQI